MNEPLGIRGNNPLNLCFVASIVWTGQTGANGRYCTFATMPDGLRAGAVDLLNAQRLHGRSTLREIITPFAPDSENDTAAYIADVAARTGWFADDKIVLRAGINLDVLVSAMAIHEEGVEPFESAIPPAMVAEACRLARLSVYP